MVRFNQHDSGCAGIDAPEVTGQCLSCDFGNRARHFDTGGAAPDDHECQQPLALGIISSELRLLKSGQNVATDTGSVFDALETRSDIGPAMMTEIRICCSVAITKKSNGNGPAFVFTTRAWVSIPSTSAMNTVAFSCRRKIWRIGHAISAGDSAAVATW